MVTCAIIRSGNKQYSVSPGDEIDVELLHLQKGERVEFQEVLFLRREADVQVGVPTVPKAVVLGEVMAQIRGPKVIAYKYKRRKRSTRRKVGHRQDYTRVKITEV